MGNKVVTQMGRVYSHICDHLHLCLLLHFLRTCFDCQADCCVFQVGRIIIRKTSSDGNYTSSYENQYKHKQFWISRAHTSH
jgi:hypothetical protein